MAYVETAILKTLHYSDIFDFPLTRCELWEYLVIKEKIDEDVFKRSIEGLIKSKSILQSQGYFCLIGREKTIKKRQKNLPEVSKKLDLAKRAAFFLSLIPTVQFIGISGGLAMHDVDEIDDIDFFIIAKKKTLFLTRIWILGILESLKLRRVRNDKNPKDKICVNYIIDESRLKFSKEKHDIYIAHEIVQLKPLFERDGASLKFFESNKWVNKFFTNAEMPEVAQAGFLRSNVFSIFNCFFRIQPITTLVEWVQIAYIKKHQTIELVGMDSVAFHPNDYRVQTLNELKLRFHELGLLTKV